MADTPDTKLLVERAEPAANTMHPAMEEHVAYPLSQGQIEEHKEAERNIADTDPAASASALIPGPVLGPIPAPGGLLNPGGSIPTAPEAPKPVRNRLSSRDTFYVLTADEDDVADGADKEVPPGTQFPEWWASESIILRGPSLFSAAGSRAMN